MSIYLKELSINDGVKELEYLRKLPFNENGFYNLTRHSLSFECTREYALKFWAYVKSIR